MRPCSEYHYSRKGWKCGSSASVLAFHKPPSISPLRTVFCTWSHRPDPLPQQLIFLEKVFIILWYFLQGTQGEQKENWTDLNKTFLSAPPFIPLESRGTRNLPSRRRAYNWINYCAFKRAHKPEPCSLIQLLLAQDCETLVMRLVWTEAYDKWKIHTAFSILCIKNVKCLINFYIAYIFDILS